jgi:hypothetical protein
MKALDGVASWLSDGKSRPQGGCLMFVDLTGPIATFGKHYCHESAVAWKNLYDFVKKK